VNPFVNTQKRDFDLPEGCSDLVDVLQMPRPVLGFKLTWKLVWSVGEMQGLLSRFLSATKLRRLSIQVPRHEHTVRVEHFAAGLGVALFINCGERGVCTQCVQYFVAPVLLLTRLRAI